MAKFKPYKILESQLDSLPIKEGQFILTTDTKKLYSDTAANTRILISPDTITNLSVNGTTITYTRLDGTTGTITTKDTTYSVASTIKNGLMSADDKAKLNSIESNAQRNTVTGVKGESETLYRTGNINITKSNIGLSNVENKSSAAIREEITSTNIITALDFTPISSDLKGANGGLAELDSTGKIPISQLPSYVDDVVEYLTKEEFPIPGESGKIYIETSTNKSYRWGGSVYAEISSSLALGTTSSSAFRGDHGETAYKHATDANAVNTTYEASLYKIGTTAEGHVKDCIPVTKEDITSLGIPGQDTTYGNATTNNAGLMSKADKAKLDGIDTGAQKNTVFGVKGGAESEYRVGNINITKANIGLGNVDNKSSATIRGEITSSNVTSALGYTPLNSNLKGANSGLAELDASGKVPTSQLPSYVDDVLEYSAKASFPATGETGKIYVDTSNNKTYRWGGSAYVEISASITLGTTSSTAFRGDYGQAAYTHAVTNKGAAFGSGLYKITTNAEGHVTGATAVVKSDITGLGIPTQDTTYSAATTSAAGLMSSEDKTKLDGIAAGAQKNTITGVKGNAETSYRTGNVNITKGNIGLGNVDNTADANKNVLSATKLTTARKINDVSFDGSADINISKIVPIDVTGQTIDWNTYTLANNYTEETWICKTDGGGNNFTNLAVIGKACRIQLRTLRNNYANDCIQVQEQWVGSTKTLYRRYCTNCTTWSEWVTVSVNGIANKATTATSASSATKATQDKNGNDITTTYVKKAGDTMTNELAVSGIPSNGGQIRLYNGSGSSSYGTILRNDGNITYVLLTDAGKQTDTWNSLRPLQITNSTGKVTMQNGLAISNGLTTNNESITSDADSTSATTGSLVSKGGIGIAKAINAGTTITAAAALKSTEGTVDLADSAAQMKYNSTDKCIDFIFS